MNQKVLIYSHFFYPSTGGVETVSQNIAEGLLSLGLECKIITTTNEFGDRKFPFEIFRNPSLFQKINLIKWADIILFNGANLALQPWILLLRKQFIWIHVGYQVSCIDGAGWIDGKKAPLTPLDSFKSHLKLFGFIKGMFGGIKLLMRRFFAKHLVYKNIAITDWMLNIQPLPRQIRIYNPFPLDNFRKVNNTSFDYEFMYVGRLVSEKGVSTLLRAFSKILENQNAKLLIIGDGNYRKELENLAKSLNIYEYTKFVGKKTGSELLKYVAKGKIAIIPSYWFEPMGGVALEMLAARKNLIVSDFGGLKECVKGAALTFENGNEFELAHCMTTILNDETLQKKHLENAEKIVDKFSPDLLVKEYYKLLQGELN